MSTRKAPGRKASGRSSPHGDAPDAASGDSVVPRWAQELLDEIERGAGPNAARDDEFAAAWRASSKPEHNKASQMAKKFDMTPKHARDIAERLGLRKKRT